MGIFNRILSVFKKQDVEGYCVGCKKNQKLTNIRYHELNGKQTHRRRSGICSVCDKTASNFVPAA